MIRLSAFADEISPDLDQQIEVLQSEGIQFIELRSVWGKGVLELTDSEVDKVKNMTAAAGMRVLGIGSPIGKVPADTPIEKELLRLERAANLVKLLEAESIRIFSYYPPQSDPAAEPEDFRQLALDNLEALTAYATQQDVLLLHENDTDLYGATLSRSADVMEQIQSPCLGAILDPANFALSGEITFPDAYHQLRTRLRCVHVKDAKAGMVVAAGEGSVRFPDLLSAMKSDGFAGYLALEPHLQSQGRYSGFSGVELFRRAARSFQKLLQELDWEWE